MQIMIISKNIALLLKHIRRKHLPHRTFVLMKDKLNLGIFLFNEVEALDFAGPFKVFSLAEKDGKKAFWPSNCHSNSKKDGV